MKDKVFLITGATSGIGKITALEVAKLGATVVLVGRNKAKTEGVVKEIKEKSGNEKVSYLLADLSIQKEVKNLAEEFKQKFDRLDVLVNNAGLLMHKKELTPDNLEYSFATNHMAYFILTNLLLDLLKKSAPSRIVSVASEAHRMGDLDFDDINFEKHSYSPWKAYGKSKLNNILFTYELADRLKGTGVTANCLHPGVVNTGFTFIDIPIVKPIVEAIVKPFLLTPEKGAETQIYLATSEEVNGVTGKYFSKKRSTPSSTNSHSKEAQKKLWELSEKLSGLSA